MSRLLQAADAIAGAAEGLEYECRREDTSVRRLEIVTGTDPARPAQSVASMRPIRPLIPIETVQPRIG